MEYELKDLANKECREKEQEEQNIQSAKLFVGQEEKLEALGKAFQILTDAGVRTLLFAEINNNNYIGNRVFLQYNNFGDFLKYENGEMSTESKMEACEINHSIAASIGNWFQTYGLGSSLFERSMNGFHALLKGYCLWANEGQEPEEYKELKNK